MNTEITDIKNEPVAGWVGYDAGCALCRRGAERFRPWLERRGFAVVPLQSPGVRRALKLSEADLLAEMRVITRDGAVHSGADGILYLAKAIRWGWPLVWLAAVPGMKPLLHRIYRHVARHRHCFNGVCAAPSTRPARRNWPGWLPLVIVTAAAVAFGRGLPGWSFMWVLALALFAGCKWLTFWVALGKGVKPGSARAAGYLLAWPGMNANSFLAKPAAVARPPVSEWLFAAGKILFGTILLWGFAPRFADRPLWAGWIGMIGLIFALHFGLLHLFSLAWRNAGVDAPPLMRAPALARSIAEFWGVRWNTGFHQLAHDFLFRPLVRVAGVRAATLTVFLGSGLIHDLVISLPARGGYGLPTLYFLAQGAGVLFERSHLARRCGVGNEWPGRLIMICVTAGPVFWLFHPPFVLNVMIPFLKAIHAL